MTRIAFLLGFLVVAGCSTVPENVSYGCGARTISWAFGPNKNLPYVDVCSVSVDGADLKIVYNFAPIIGTNPDTRQQIDPDHNGISGDGQWRDDAIHWGGNSCQQYARRITQKGCEQFGNSRRSAGCEWIAFQLIPKKEIEAAFVTLTPIWHVRLPDGREVDLQGKELLPGFKDCR